MSVALVCDAVARGSSMFTVSYEIVAGRRKLSMGELTMETNGPYDWKEVLQLKTIMFTEMCDIKLFVSELK